MFKPSALATADGTSSGSDSEASSTSHPPSSNSASGPLATLRASAVLPMPPEARHRHHALRRKPGHVRCAVADRPIRLATSTGKLLAATPWVSRDGSGSVWRNASSGPDHPALHQAVAAARPVFNMNRCGPRASATRRCAPSVPSPEDRARPDAIHQVTFVTRRWPAERTRTSMISKAFPPIGTAPASRAIRAGQDRFHTRLPDTQSGARSGIVTTRL